MEKSVIPWTSISYFVESISDVFSELKGYRDYSNVRKKFMSTHRNFGVNQKWDSN